MFHLYAQELVFKSNDLEELALPLLILTRIRTITSIVLDLATPPGYHNRLFSVRNFIISHTDHNYPASTVCLVCYATVFIKCTFLSHFPVA